jgi:hypothetical protein
MNSTVSKILFPLLLSAAFVFGLVPLAASAPQEPEVASPQRGPEVKSASRVRRSKEATQLMAHHHYNSPAERAQDALLMTEVAADLKKEGLTQNHPILIDADHGVVTLTGVLPSPEAAKRAEEIAASEVGVIAVHNKIIAAGGGK